MRKCKYDELIDNYLFNRLSEEERQEFEEHYFDCPVCFVKLEEPETLISAVKYKGHEIFQDVEQDKERFYISPNGVVLVTPDMLGQVVHHVR